jgi:diguanylate cyclase (GGDEF)-like protein
MLRRQKVLLIDDSPVIHRVVRARIEDLGVDTIDAFAGREGLETARREQPDLILLDVALEGESGFEVCAQLKQDQATVHIPVIFISGAEDTFNKVQAFDLGAVDFVIKPFDPAELRARVRAALRTKALMDMLTTQAQLDGLTGLHNRGYFDKRLGQEVSAGRRYGRSVGLLLIDVDHFKQINDDFGHPKGDQVLRKLADLIRSVVRESDVACRYGGEEMAVILAESSPSDARHAGLRLLEEIRKNEELMSLLGRAVTVSIGAACTVPDASTTPESLLRDADKALYRAKAAGRNRVATAFDPNASAA